MASFPTQVIADIDLGKQYFSDMNADHITDLKSGCSDCLDDTYVCLQAILRDLGYKRETDNFDDVAMTLYLKMMFIIGGVPYSPTAGTIYFGSASSAAPLTLPDILAGSSIPYELGDPIIIPWNVPSYAFIWVAIPNFAPVPNHYQDQSYPLNSGQIGSSTDLLNAPYVVDMYNVLFSNYPVLLTSSLLLKNI